MSARAAAVAGVGSAGFNTTVLPKARAGADFQAIVSALLELKGEDATAAWLKALKENAATFYKAVQHIPCTQVFPYG